MNQEYDSESTVKSSKKAKGLFYVGVTQESKLAEVEQELKRRMHKSYSTLHHSTKNSSVFDTESKNVPPPLKSRSITYINSNLMKQILSDPP